MQLPGSARHLLVIEDDPGLQRQLRWNFEGFDVAVAGDRVEGLTQLRRLRPAVVTLDLGLPPDPGGVSEGFATLEEITALTPETKVIVLTGNDDRENAVRAIGCGAYDFCSKPLDAHLLNLMVQRAQGVFELEAENRRLRRPADDSALPGIIAASPQMLRAFRSVERVADTDVTVLLLGESGTGKELFARALHRMSSRAKQPLVAINCAAIPEELLESELFGYERGAFTGAVKQTRGKIEHADGGTLFLDEIGDLPGALQSKLLRFLQERTIERIGGRQEIPVNVRVICATHQDLQRQISDGRFRLDLFYRVSEISISLPALREREGDPLLLAHAFLDKYSRKFSKNLRGFTRDAVAAIERHPWPGNVREMENCIKRAVVLADRARLSCEDLNLAPDDQCEKLPISLQGARQEAEMRAVRLALAHSIGNVSEAARLLGVTRPTLYGLLDKYDLKAVMDAASGR